jgi:hypothetical protein
MIYPLSKSNDPPNGESGVIKRLKLQVQKRTKGSKPEEERECFEGQETPKKKAWAHREQLPFLEMLACMEPDRVPGLSGFDSHEYMHILLLVAAVLLDGNAAARKK